MKFYYWLVIVMAGMLWSNSLLAKASFSVAPGVLNFDLSQSNTRNFIITNNGDERIRLIIRPIYFAIDSKFLSGGKLLNPEKPPQDDLSKMIIASPRVLSLRPGQKRNIRVAVRTNKKILPGDHRAHLLVRTLKGTKPKKKKIEQQTEGLTIELNMVLETAIAVYGRIGKPEITLDWKCRTNNKGDFILTAVNKSDWKYNGWLIVNDQTKAGEGNRIIEAKLVVFRNSERYYMVQKPHPRSIQIRWGVSKDNPIEGRKSCKSAPPSKVEPQNPK